MAGEETDVIETGGADTTDTQQTDQQQTDQQQTDQQPQDILDSDAGDKAKDQTDDDLLSDDETSDDEGVPDQYTFEPPEGVSVDEATLETFKETAKELGLSQKAFDKLVEFDLQRSQAAMEQAASGWSDRVNGWRTDARADSEIGGQNFDNSVKAANQLVKQFGDDGLRALLRSPSEQNPEGLAIGNHPAFLRFVNRIAKAVGEPDPVEGDDRQTRDVSFEGKATRMYPSMQKN